MTSDRAKELVVVSMVGTGVLTSISAYHRHSSPSPRIFVGVIAYGAILATVAEAAPDLAGAFAALVLVSAAFVVGPDAWQAITSATTNR